MYILTKSWKLLQFWNLIEKSQFCWCLESETQSKTQIERSIVVVAPKKEQNSGVKIWKINSLVEEKKKVKTTLIFNWILSSVYSTLNYPIPFNLFLIYSYKLKFYEGSAKTLIFEEKHSLIMHFRRKVKIIIKKIPNFSSRRNHILLWKINEKREFIN